MGKLPQLSANQWRWHTNMLCWRNEHNQELSPAGLMRHALALETRIAHLEAALRAITVASEGWHRRFAIVLSTAREILGEEK